MSGVSLLDCQDTIASVRSLFLGLSILQLPVSRGSILDCQDCHCQCPESLSWTVKTTIASVRSLSFGLSGHHCQCPESHSWTVKTPLPGSKVSLLDCQDYHCQCPESSSAYYLIRLLEQNPGTIEEFLFGVSNIFVNLDLRPKQCSVVIIFSWIQIWDKNHVHWSSSKTQI